MPHHDGVGVGVSAPAVLCDGLSQKSFLFHLGTLANAADDSLRVPLNLLLLFLDERGDAVTDFAGSVKLRIGALA